MKIINTRQHYVPKFYLKNFGELLYAFDKTTGDKFRTTPKNIGMESNFYGGEVEGAPSFEQALSSLEYDFSKAIHELIKKENYELLTDTSKINIHKFLSLQYIRTPGHRKEIVESYNYILNEVAKSKGFDDANVRLAKKSEIGVHLESIKDYPLYAMLIGRMKFMTIIDKTPIPFWTSDNPVCFDNFVPSAMGNLGIINRGVQIHVPISPKILLVAMDPIFFGDMPNIHEIYNKKGILFENFLQAENSSRWVFSNTKKFYKLKDMIEKNPELTNPKRERAQIDTGKLGDSDVIGFSRQSSRSGILREGGLETWMPMDEYEEIKKYYDDMVKSQNESSSQDNTLPDSES